MPEMLRAADPAVIPAVEGGVEEAGPSTSFERTDKGSDSREPPKREEGAMARIDAFVSRELRRTGRWEDDARVRTEALSLRRPFAVALL